GRCGTFRRTGSHGSGQGHKRGGGGMKRQQARLARLGMTLVFALTLTAGCHSGDTATATDSGQSYAVVTAHRGGAAYAPENTMTAFRNAVRLGVDRIETDTQ